MKYINKMQKTFLAQNFLPAQIHTSFHVIFAFHPHSCELKGTTMNVHGKIERKWLKRESVDCEPRINVDEQSYQKCQSSQIKECWCPRLKNHSLKKFTNHFKSPKNETILQSTFRQLIFTKERKHLDKYFVAMHSSHSPLRVPK